MTNIFKKCLYFCTTVNRCACRLHKSMLTSQSKKSCIKTPTFQVDTVKIKKVQQLYPTIFKKHSPDSNIYCIEKKVADFIQDCVRSMKTSDNNSPVFESNAGLGLVTESLLQNGVENLCVFETQDPFIGHLQDLSKEYPGKLQIIPIDLVLMPSLNANDSKNYMDEIFSKLTVRLWKDRPTVTMIVSISQSKVTFLRFLFPMLATMQSIFTFGRPELFVIVSNSEYETMFASKEDSYNIYRSASVFYTLFFDIHFIEKRNTNNNYYYFLHLVPKADLFDSVISQERLPDLYLFVKHSFVKRTNFIIPTIETWIPNVGPLLIKNGIGMFKRFGELSPREILDVFKLIVAMPNYEASTLQMAATKISDYNCDDEQD